MGGICTCIKTRPECLSDVEIDHATKSSDSEQSHFLGPDQFQEVPHVGITTGEEIAFDRDVLEPSGSFEHGAADKTTEMGGIHACVNTQSEDLSDAEADHATTLSVSEEKLFLDPDLFQGDPHTGASPPEEIAFDRSVSEPSGSFYHGADLNTAISAFLSNCEDHQLLRLTRFYKERLEQAIEEGVEGVGFMLMGEDHFTGLEYHSVTELAEKGNRACASKLLLDLVMEKGSGARRVMWESFVKLHHHLPKLSRILNEIRERGDGQFAFMDTERGLSEAPKHLKDVQQKHKETLRIQTETLRVNTILMREKVKVFQLVNRYADLTVISTVRDRRQVEHELLARGRDHEEWREKHLRTELEKIRADQLFQRSFDQKLKRSFFGRKSGISAAVAGVPGIGKTTMVQKIVYDWATGKIYQQFQFVFSFKFRDLNSINCRISLKELILHQYPYFGNILGEIWKHTEVWMVWINSRINSRTKSILLMVVERQNHST
ncbi:uncharacterized protein [Hemitrygon akajei]|uniref:uncharacterized protein n=1 Tax=Hemitrygon akajei TaxID=2704970 RepID=UPI003BF9D460